MNLVLYHVFLASLHQWVPGLCFPMFIDATGVGGAGVWLCSHPLSSCGDFNTSTVTPMESWVSLPCAPTWIPAPCSISLSDGCLLVFFYNPTNYDRIIHFWLLFLQHRVLCREEIEMRLTRVLNNFGSVPAWRFWWGILLGLVSVLCVVFTHSSSEHGSISYVARHCRDQSLHFSWQA